MGKNKALIKIHDKELLLQIVESLEPLVEEIIVSEKNQQNESAYRNIVSKDVKIIPDIIELDGPLVGIYSALLETSSEYAYIQPVDSPFVNKDLVEYLFKEAVHYDGAVITNQNGTIEPLHAVYKVDRCIVEAKNALDAGDTSVRGIAKRMHVNYIKTEKLRKFDEKLLSLININTPEDLSKLSEYLKFSDDYRT
jgi:molybdopterin-guanine dinucleotide biosynthesis protein A